MERFYCAAGDAVKKQTDNRDKQEEAARVRHEYFTCPRVRGPSPTLESDVGGVAGWSPRVLGWPGAPPSPHGGPRGAGDRGEAGRRGGGGALCRSDTLC